MDLPPVSCPYCGEPGDIDADVDDGADGGGPQKSVFVQDCAVCCRPWTVHVEVARDGEVSAWIEPS